MVDVTSAEAGLIARTLMSHPDVSDAEVTSHPESPKLRMAVVCTGNFVTGPELREYVEATLGTANALDVIAILSEIPRDDAGRLDVPALREHLAPGASTYHFVPPRSAAERWLAELWETLLGCNRVGVLDDFLELGGNSITAMQVLTEIQVKYGAEVPITDFFELATIDRLVSALGNCDGPEADSVS